MGNEFDEYITGIMQLTVGNKDLKLDVDLKDKRKLKSAYAGGKMDEVALEKIDNAFLGILVKSYPDANVKGLEGYYSKNDIEFLEKFMIKVGWANEDAFKKVKGDAKPSGD